MRIDKIVKIWNEVFPEKERKVNGPPWNINSIAYESIREGESSFELAQYKTAFEQLRKHKSLSWLFHSAVKPDNLRQMLIEARNGSARGQPSDRRKVLPDRDSYPKTEEEFWQ